MQQLFITVKKGMAVKNPAKIAGCLMTRTQVLWAIKPMSGAQLTAFYKSLTGKTVKRFASKDDASKRIYKYIAPTGGTKSGPTVLPSRKKAPVVSRTATVNKMLGKKEPGKSKVLDKTISILPHEGKIFQKGSVRKQCYDIIIANANRKKLPVSDYVGLAIKNDIDERSALSCLKKLTFTNQISQSMELV